MPRKFLAKKISKKIKSNYGVPMEDVLKKENDPKKAEGGEAKKVPKYWVGAAIAAGTALASGIYGASQAKKQKAEQKKAALSEAQQSAAAGQSKVGKKMLGGEEALKRGGGVERKKCPGGKEYSKGGWIKGAVKKPGALRAIAEKRKLIKGKEKLSSSDLSKLGSQAKKSGDSLLSKRVSLAKTFAKMRKK